MTEKRPTAQQTEQLFFALDEIDDWLGVIESACYEALDLGEYYLPTTIVRAAFAELDKAIRPALES